METNTRIESWEREIDRRAGLRVPSARLTYRPVEERTQDFNEACLGYTPETARLEASRCIQCPEPQACALACPLHNDIPHAMERLAAGDFLGAAAIYRQTNPLSEVCGRVCPERFCQDACTLKRLDKPLDTRRLEAFTATFARTRVGMPTPEIAPRTGKRVAIIGAGPSVTLSVRRPRRREGSLTHARGMLRIARDPSGVPSG